MDLFLASYITLDLIIPDKYAMYWENIEESCKSNFFSCKCLQSWGSD